jgi:hypothetical protein
LKGLNILKNSILIDLTMTPSDQIPETYIQKFKIHIQKIVAIADNEFDRILAFFHIKKINKKEYLILPRQHG